MAGGVGGELGHSKLWNQEAPLQSTPPMAQELEGRTRGSSCGPGARQTVSSSHASWGAWMLLETQGTRRGPRCPPLASTAFASSAVSPELTPCPRAPGGRGLARVTGGMAPVMGVDLGPGAGSDCWIRGACHSHEHRGQRTGVPVMS